MSVRMFQARLECDRETLGRLWLTHRVFNERLPAIISVLFRGFLVGDVSFSFMVKSFVESPADSGYRQVF